MASADTNSIQAFENYKNKKKGISNESSRQEIQSAIAESMELRALHAALVQNSAAIVKSPVSRPPLSQFSAQDYPIFTPIYEDHTFSGYQHIRMQSQTISEPWDEHGGSVQGRSDNETTLNNYIKEILLEKKKKSPSSEYHNCQAEDRRSVTSTSTNPITVLHTSPMADVFKSSRRNDFEDFKSESSCNKCKPAVITKNSNTIVPLTDSHSSVQSQQKNRGMISRLYSKLRKRHSSPNRTESEDVSTVFKDIGIMSIEALKRELIQANENKDKALSQVSEMKSSVNELRQKLEYLETYCEELKKALTKATRGKGSQIPQKLGNRETVEGFLQIVSESRHSVKKFCKILTSHIDEADTTLTNNLNSILQPYKLSLNSKYSKMVSYHFESVVNQSLYQDFENCVFQKNGTAKHLDPEEACRARFSMFTALRDLSWNEVLKKGTKYYSEELSKFCDERMCLIATAMKWTRPWTEQLLQAFFVSAKYIWLLHLLAFSFNPALGILRVEENRSFDSCYMEDVIADKQRPYGSSRVKIMVMPGFYVQEMVLKCKVICRYKSVV